MKQRKGTQILEGLKRTGRELAPLTDLRDESDFGMQSAPVQVANPSAEGLATSLTAGQLWRMVESDLEVPFNVETYTLSAVQKKRIRQLLQEFVRG